LLIWAVDVLTYLPAQIFSLAHHSSLLVGRDYLRDLNRIEIWAALIRAGTLLAFSLLFFQGGRGIQRFLLGSEQSPQSAEETAHLGPNI
jgi:hypothetical protein